MRKLLTAIILPALLALAFLSGPVQAAKTKGAAAVSSLQGKVEISTDGKKWGDVSKNDVLDPGMILRTGAGGKIKLVLDDGTAVVIGEMSQVRISKLDVDYASSDRTTEFDLESGAARASVSKLSSKTSQFEIRTPSAVAGVRGTDFAVELDDDATTHVTVFEGRVEVGSVIEKIRDRVILEKDNTTDVMRDKAPGAPRKLDKEKLLEKKQKLSRLIDKKLDEKADGIDEDKARIVVVAHVNKLPEAQRDKLMEQVESGAITADRAQRILTSVHKGISQEDANRALDLAAVKGMPAEKVDALIDQIEKGAKPADIKARLDDLDKARAGIAGSGKPGDISAEDLDRLRETALKNMDRKKVDEMLEKLDPSNPARRELQLISLAIERGIPRERLEPLLGALKNGLLNDGEAVMLLNAIKAGVDLKRLMAVLERIRDLKPDPKLRALIIKALSVNVDLKDLADKIEAAKDLTPEQLRERLEQLIKNRINSTTGAGGTSGTIDGGIKQ